MAESGEESRSAGEGREIHIKEVDQALNVAPEIFVDGAQGLSVSEGVVRINFYQDKMLTVMSDEDKDVVRRTICLRMVLTHKTLIQFYQWLTSPVERLQELQSSASEEEAQGAKPDQ